ncbi:MAG TPA: SpoIIE family protein phosphatase [Acidimicrobiales bacterium]|nr:SpoIIE family protein phosphatase [Acidimicrobiales bacterium]
MPDTEHLPGWGVAAEPWVAEAAAVALLVAGRDGVISYANASAGALLGCEPEELVGAPVADLVPERFRPAHLAGFERHWGADPPSSGVSLSVTALRRDGSELPVEVQVSDGRGPDGERVLVAALVDIRRSAAVAAEQRLARYLAATSEVAVALTSLDPSDVTGAASRVLEVLVSTLGSPWGRLWLADDGQLGQAAVAGPASAPKASDPPASADPPTSRDPSTSADPPTPDELVLSAWIESQPARADCGEWTRMVVPLSSGRRSSGALELEVPAGWARDQQLLGALTTVGTALAQFVGRSEAERQSRFRAALLASESEASPDGVLVVGPDNRVASANRRLEEMAGRELAAMVGADADTMRRVLAEVAQDPVGTLARVDEAKEGSRRSRFEVALRDGRTVDCYTAPLHGEGDIDFGRVWFFRDITHRKMTEEGLASLARTLQASLLPPHLPDVPGLEVGARYQAAGRGLEVGGDFFDLFAVRARTWGLVIGDVCGKGAEAATVTALARYAVRATAMTTSRPAQIASSLNQLVQREYEGEKFLTALLATVTPRPGGAVLTLCSAGHPLPLVVRPDGSVTEAGRPGPLIGFFDDPRYVDHRIRLSPGETLVAFTDGVTEARHRGRFLGEGVMQELVSAMASRTPQQIADALADEAARRGGGTPADDVAVLALRVRD